jgi:hypothetical protein
MGEEYLASAGKRSNIASELAANFLKQALATA